MSVVLLLCFVLCLLFLSLNISTAQYASAGCGKPSPGANGSTKTYTFNYLNYNRSYIVHIPINWNNNNITGNPVILGLHGYTNTASYFEKYFGMTEQSDEKTYLAIYLQATYFKDPNNPSYEISSWNDGDCGLSPGIYGPTCDPTSVKPVPRPINCNDIDGNQCNWCNCNVDDIATIDYLMNLIEHDYCIDISRQYVIGFSQGGMLTHSIGCSLANRFAAIAPFHGARHIGFDCLPNNNYAMPIMEVWGTRDQEVPGQSVLSGDGWYYIPVSNIQEQFAKHNGCDLSNGVIKYDTVSDGIDNWSCVTWNKNCNNNSFTIDCSWSGTHTYPIKGNNYFGLNVAWNFLSQFRRL